MFVYLLLDIGLFVYLLLDIGLFSLPIIRYWVVCLQISYTLYILQLLSYLYLQKLEVVDLAEEAKWFDIMPIELMLQCASQRCVVLNPTEKNKKIVS
jgi:hypothetical protein